jgi:hypothetical protein
VKEEYFYLDATPTHVVREGALQVPARAYPYERAGAQNRRARRGAASSSCSTPRASRAGASTSRSNTPRPRRRTSSCGHDRQPRARRPAALHVLPHALVQQHLVLGVAAARGTTRSPPSGVDRRGGGPRRRCAANTPRLAATCSRSPPRRPRTWAAVHRERDQRERALFGAGDALRVHEGRVPPARLRRRSLGHPGRPTPACSGASSSTTTTCAGLARGRPGQPAAAAAPARAQRDWAHLYNRDVISMPDKWEYPWYAAWDLAFHMIPFAELDPHFAKEQLCCCCASGTCTPTGRSRPTSSRSAT